MTEIIEQVYYEIKNSGFESRLIAGLVVTGGGSQLKHIAQLFEFTTGMDTRIGYPTEHLAAGTEEITSPSFSTGVGLVLEGYHIHEYQAKLLDSGPQDSMKGPTIAPVIDATVDDVSNEVEKTTSEIEIENPHDDITSFGTKRSSWFQDLFDKTRRYLEEDED
jgi:cell division ATPase FtsA